MSSHAAIISLCVILYLKKIYSTIDIKWIIPDGSFLYAYWFLVSPRGVQEYTIWCLTYLVTFIIRLDVPHFPLKNMLLTAMAVPYEIKEAVYVSNDSFVHMSVYIYSWDFWNFVTFQGGGGH